MMTTTFEKGVAKGREEGREEGRKTGREEGREETLEKTRRLLQRQLEFRFGPLPEPVAQKLRSLPIERLEELGIAFMTAQSLSELGLHE